MVKLYNQIYILALSFIYFMRNIFKKCEVRKLFKFLKRLKYGNITQLGKTIVIQLFGLPI